MGTTVLNATAALRNLDPDVRVYAHCGAAPSLYAAESGANPLGVILININVTVRTVHSGNCIDECCFMLFEPELDVCSDRRPRLSRSPQVRTHSTKQHEG
jgi:hypothetical protein